MNIRTRPYAIGAAAVLALALTACGSASTGTAASGATSSPSASSPSAPNSTSTSSIAPAMTTSTGMYPATPTASVGGMPMPSAPAGPHNQGDIAFAQQMLVHHQGAIEMADLAPTRASSPAVKDLAVKIKAAQAPEITEMSGWLAAWAPSTDMNGMPMTTSSGTMGGTSGMDHSGSTAASMPGMMSDAQMGQLTAATGTAFDKLFLQLMIAHHQGALEMAGTEKAAGQNPSALALATSITTSQTAQITVMQDLLKGL